MTNIEPKLEPFACSRIDCPETATVCATPGVLAGDAADALHHSWVRCTEAESGNCTLTSSQPLSCTGMNPRASWRNSSRQIQQSAVDHQHQQAAAEHSRPCGIQRWTIEAALNVEAGQRSARNRQDERRQIVKAAMRIEARRPAGVATVAASRRQDVQARPAVALGRRVRPEQHGRQRRAQRQRVEGRNHRRDGDRDGELAEELPGDAA